MNNQTVFNINNRDFDECFFSIMCIPIPIYFKYSNLSINKTTFYLFFACNINGVRKYLCTINTNDFNNVSDYYDLFLSFKNRKLNTIFYALIPDNNLIKNAIKLAFPEITCFISPFDAINKVFKYYPYKYSSNVFKYIKNIYTSSTINDFNISLQAFYDNFNDSLFLKDILNNNFIQAKKYYSFNNLIRKHVFSFYFIRDLLKKLSVISHSKEYFTSIDEFVECLIPIIKTCETKMYCSKFEWISIINFLYENKKDLIKSFL